MKTQTSPSAAFGKKNFGLHKWRDMGFAFGAPLLFLVVTTLLGLKTWPVALGVANIITVAFTSLTVGGVLFGRWCADMEAAARSHVEAIREGAVARHETQRRWWKIGTRRFTYKQDEANELTAIEASLSANISLRDRVEYVTYVLFMVAVISGGFAIAAEIRSMPELCWNDCSL